jgi:hypothetical protein
METISKYIQALNKEINKLGGDSKIAFEYESQLQAEFMDYSYNQKHLIDNNLEIKFISSLEHPKIIAKSLLGLNDNDSQLERNQWFFSEKQRILIGKSYFLVFGFWVLFLFISANLSIFAGNDSIKDFRKSLIPFGYAIILFLYVSIIIIFILQYKKYRTLPVVKLRYFLIEMVWLVTIALTNHYIIIELYNMIGRLVSDGWGRVPESLNLYDGFNSFANLSHAIEHVILLYLAMYIIWYVISFLLLKKKPLVHSIFLSVFPLLLSLICLILYFTTYNLFFYIY